MPLDKDDPTQEIDEASGAGENPNRAERIDDRHPRDRVAGREKGRDMRSIIKGAIKEVNVPERRTPDGNAPQESNQRDGAPKAPAPDKSATDRGEAASPARKETPEAKPGVTAPAAASQTSAPIAAPAALSKEVKAIWDGLPDPVKAEFVRRETDTAKGVEQLKAKYRPIEDAFAPVRDQLQRLGKTEAEAADQLIKWQAALAGPNKVQAFRALARAHGLHLSTLAPQAPKAGDANPHTDQAQNLRPYIDPVLQRVAGLEGEFQRQKSDRVNADIMTYSKDKPHFERVRVAMGHLMNSGLASGSTPKETFDDAYARACRADPEVFALLQQEDQAKKDADAKTSQEAAAKKAAEDAEVLKRKQAEEVVRARRAGVGPRAGSPSGMAIAAKAKGEKVGDTIRNAIKDARAAV